MPNSKRLALALLLTAVTCRTPAGGAEFAAEVVAYQPGTGATGFEDPRTALGPPDPLTGENFGFPSVLSLFSPPFEADEIVIVGGGGSLTLRLPRFANAIDGPELGVFTNVGLIDTDFPNGQVGSPATAFGIDSAFVEVSEFGHDWVALADTAIEFALPTTFFLNAGPYDTAPPADARLADFGIPFTPLNGLEAFSGKPYLEAVELLQGSAGGTWLDVSSTGLDRVGYIRFSVPVGQGSVFKLDAVSIADAAVGTAVPESATLLATAVLLTSLLSNRLPFRRAA